jgi:PleD family two-component response regulator
MMHPRVTSSSTTGTDQHPPVSRAGGAAQKVLIVNGSSDVLETLEPVLAAGNYDVVFVEASAHAYSQIKRVLPDLVILCVEMNDAEGLNVLSMLKLDGETTNIPVMTYTGSGDGDAEDREGEPAPRMRVRRLAPLMN